MGYPTYPVNRLIVDGVDITERFGIILVDGYTLTPPSPKTYSIDIPGGNGKLDLTESLFGDTAYDNRKQEFVFNVIKAANFEQTKTNVSNFLHGKDFNYVWTKDPNYVYSGRFTVSSYNHKAYTIGIVGEIKVTVDSEPFKHKPTQIYRINAVGGNIYYFSSGRERVRPSIESDGYLKIIFKGKLYALPKGTWTLKDILFENGENEIYFNSFTVHNLTWKDIVDNNITWGTFKTKRLFEWYKSNGDGIVVITQWNDMQGQTWGDLSGSTWADMLYREGEVPTARDTYVKYEWGDL